MKGASRRWSWLALVLALLSGSVNAGLFDRFGSSSEERILDAAQAFQLTINAVDPLTLEARWIIAPGYYLYRDKFRLNLLDAPDLTVTGLDILPGESKDDPYFGRQQVFHNEAVVVARLQRDSRSAQTVRVKVDYQGCAEIGVCYPPLSQTLSVALPALPPLPPASDINPERSSLLAAGEGAGTGVKAAETAPKEHKLVAAFGHVLA